MIGLARLYCYKGPEFKLVEVPAKEARKKRKELALEQWAIVHTEVI